MRAAIAVITVALLAGAASVLAYTGSSPDTVESEPVLFGLIPSALAQTTEHLTSGGSLLVQITPSESSFAMDFINPDTGLLQEHVDYIVSVTNGDTQIFGPISLTHTTPGSVTIPATLIDGTNQITVTVKGILFVPVEDEHVTIEIPLGEPTIPAWIKNSAAWWAADTIDDETFLASIKYLIEENILSLDVEPGQGETTTIPGWIKSTAQWWAEGLVQDRDFLNALKYLVENGVIVIESETSLVMGGVDLSHASPLLGDSDAPITIIEFGDYQCPKCKGWFDSTKPDIYTDYIQTGQANLYFVDLVFLGSDSRAAASASYCAQDQGKYWEYHDTLYSNQGGIGNWVTTERLVSFADQLGLDLTQFETCLNADHSDRIDFNTSQSTTLFNQTPSFLVVGPGGVQELPGAQPVAVFDRVIQEIEN